MIVIELDTPFEDDGQIVKAIAIETPIRARHLLKANRESNGNLNLFSEIFFESVCGLSKGALGSLTLEDYAKVSSVINPFLASFSRTDSK